MISYSFYLIHQPLIGLFDKVLVGKLQKVTHLDEMALRVMAAGLALVATLLIAKAFFQFVERGGIAAGKLILARSNPRLSAGS